MLLICKVILTLLLFPFASCKGINEPDQENVKQEVRTYNECGGYIEAKFDQTIILEYKPDEEYDNEELCVWEVRHEDCTGALFTKTKSGFEVGYDCLQISSTDTSYDPPPIINIMGNTTRMEQASVQAYVSYVIFTSDNSNKGTGFRLKIVGYIERTFRRVYDDFLSFSPIGSTTLRPYFNKPRVDYFSVFSMERNGWAINFRQHARHLNGNGTVSFEAEYYANFLVIFYTDGTFIPDEGGLELSWRAPNKTKYKNRA